MASKLRPEATIRRSRRRLINRLSRLSQLDLFEPMDANASREFTKLQGKIALADRELELARRRA
jgi:hypothetical protein